MKNTEKNKLACGKDLKEKMSESSLYFVIFSTILGPV